MLANFVGEEAFLNGVSKYLTDNAYGNTVTTDLWKGISHITKPLEIEPIMENWILKVRTTAGKHMSCFLTFGEQIGFPVITVKEIDGGIHVRQDRFLSTGDASDAENQTIWSVLLSWLVDRTVTEKTNRLGLLLYLCFRQMLRAKQSSTDERC
jgi:aminopeptidase 2